MRRIIFMAACFTASIAAAQTFTKTETDRWEQQAKRVNIVRDTYGVPHIYGKTDADVVFGLLYVQCEENFARVERNYLEVLGRQAEADGKRMLYADLQMKLIADTADAIRDYQNSPAWFRKLLDAFADGINYYLYKHPAVAPKVLKRFEPWFHLMFTDGSVSATRTGGITVDELRDFYSKGPDGTAYYSPVPSYETISTGSNGFAIAPKKTANGNAILYINPHVPFYFRTEVQVVSEEGLNAYGAVTWGQFFVYQGFNEHLGWMHTTGYADVADLYEEKVTAQNGNWVYEYEQEKRPVRAKTIKVGYVEDGKQQFQEFNAYYTHHGPVVGKRNGKWLSLKENNRSLNALIQSWVSTKAKNLTEFKEAMRLLSNTTNNTVYADDKGNIAYWHGDFVPKRDPSFDFTRPVDGSIAATEWKGVHALEEIVQVHNPSVGWIQNCNSTPFTAADKDSPDPKKYPAYMAPDGQNARAINAMRLLKQADQITLDKIIALGYDRYLAAFDILLPGLFKAYQNSHNTALKNEVTEAIVLLQQWDKVAAVNSVATTIATDWASRISSLLPRAATMEEGTRSLDRFEQTAQLDGDQQLLALQEAIQALQKTYGNWKQPWGTINRFQRVGEGSSFNDAQPSIAVAQSSSRWGSLPAFESRSGNGYNKRYGFSGNSFVAAVEFGKRLTARTIITGGQDSNPSSPHFTDQAEGFIQGKFKEIFFYKEDVMKHRERSYSPGQ